jgi:organic radical activating enzyme
MSQLTCLPFVESVLLRPCNLSCTGCTTYSDLKWSGYTTWAQGREEIEPWTRRLDIEAWGTMGGEPLMNPEIRDWVLGMRQLVPRAQIRLVTNGLLLERNWDLVEMLERMGNTVLKISVHVDNDRIEQMIDRIQSTWQWQAVTEFGINRWKRDNGFRFQVNRPTKFYKTFLNNYEDMAPHDNFPGDAFKVCVQQRCPLLFQGLLYKCGTAALTEQLLDRFDRPNWEQWKPYLGTGLSPDCNQSELESFIENFGKPHKICRQCPTDHDIGSQIDHKVTVKFK